MLSGLSLMEKELILPHYIILLDRYVSTHRHIGREGWIGDLILRVCLEGY